MEALMDRISDKQARAAQQKAQADKAKKAQGSGACGGGGGGGGGDTGGAGQAQAQQPKQQVDPAAQQGARKVAAGAEDAARRNCAQNGVCQQPQAQPKRGIPNEQAASAATADQASKAAKAPTPPAADAAKDAQAGKSPVGGARALARPNPTSEAGPQKNLKRGDKGDEVKKLQTELNKHGAKLEVDGKFGPKTQAAVNKFQRDNAMQADGTAGARTREALKKDPAQLAKARETKQPSGTPPAPGSVNQKIADAAKKYMGTSTRAGPDHGNLACAWSVNNIMSNAGLKKIGSNPNYVPSVEQSLKNGRGTPVSAKDAKPGDIVIFPNGHHIGVYMGDGKVANNSSSKASFTNMTSMKAGMRIYRVNN